MEKWTKHKPMCNLVQVHMNTLQYIICILYIHMRTVRIRINAVSHKAHRPTFHFNTQSIHDVYLILVQYTLVSFVVISFPSFVLSLFPFFFLFFCFHRAHSQSLISQFLSTPQYSTEILTCNFLHLVLSFFENYKLKIRPNLFVAIYDMEWFLMTSLDFIRNTVRSWSWICYFYTSLNLMYSPLPSEFNGRDERIFVENRVDLQN